MQKQISNCSICNAEVTLPKNVELTEIVSCHDCHSKLVVEKINKNSVILTKAPDVEEDWGE